MDLKTASQNVLKQLLDITEQVEDADFNRNIGSLNATIGQHIRHIAEFYICLIEGLKTGSVCYDQRKRDSRIENDKYFALERIREIINFIERYDGNPVLMLRMTYGVISDQVIELDTNYRRELAYNIEHTIHHMAIARQGLLEICRYIELPEDFGVASSTIRNSREG